MDGFPIDATILAYYGPVMETRKKAELLGRILSRRRRELGLSQSDAARIAGMPACQWNHYEHGRRLPSLEVFAAIAQVIGPVAAARALPVLSSHPSLDGEHAHDD